MSHEAGKGSGRRPTNEKSYQANFDLIFGGRSQPRPEFMAMRTELAVPIVMPDSLCIATNESEIGESV